LSNADQHDHLKLLRHESTLARFGELALKSDDLDEILTEACRLVGDALGTDLAKVMELQTDGATLMVRAGVGWEPGVVGEVTIKLMDHTSEGQAFKTGEPVISPDIDCDTRFQYPAFLTDNGVKAVANVLIIGGKDRPAFGILQVDSRVPREFTSDDVTFLRSYANLLAAAVDRLRVLEATRGGEARLRLALEGGMLGSWDFDVATGQATRTPRYDEIFGYPGPPPAWSYETFLDHVVAEDREHVASTFRHAVNARAEWNFECRIRRASDGEVRWIEARGKPDGGQGSHPPTHLLGIVGDITERKQTEDALHRSNDMLEARVTARTRELTERTRELTEANARLEAEAEERERVEEALRQAQKMEAVGQLTGGIAHDFNNLLQGISGSLELMRARATQGHTTNFSRYIDSAIESASRAATLTQRLLAFSRRQMLSPEPTNVNQLVSGMEELFRRTVGPGIQVRTSLADASWPTLCDLNQLENVLLNLVINARDAMLEGGHLLIETANNVLRDRRGAAREHPSQDVPPGDYVTLSVVDTGIGMTADVMAHAFNPFFTTKPIGQGTGLGLSMVYGFVRQSDGHVRLRSEVGQGTTVTIYLPRLVAASSAVAAESGAAATPPVLPGRGVVLVVEDEPNVRMVVCDVLSDLGYTVLEAQDGRAGLNIADSGASIDLLLTDVGLPGGMSGRQLADAARRRRPGLKVLFMTGYAEIAAGGNDRMQPGMQVITKPFALDVLAAKVQGMINSLRLPHAAS